MKPFRWQMSLTEMRRAEAVMRMAMLGKGELILRQAWVGRLGWVGFALRGWPGCRGQCPSLQTQNQESRGKEER